MVALLMNIWSYMEKNDKKMFFLLAIASLFYWFHFYWLGLVTASLVNFFDIWKNIIVTKYKKNTFLFFFFAISYGIIGVLTSNGEILSYLLVFASIITLYAAFYFHGIALRFVYLIASCIYLLYTMVWNSLSWMFTSLVFIVILSYSIYVLYQHKGILGKLRYMKVYFLKTLRKKYCFHKKRFHLFWQ